MKVALYCRVSSEAQADRGTIAAQADFLRRYADLNSLDVAHEYHDEAVTGPTPLLHRPAGLRMVQDARAGKFRVVLFYRVDRFARSLRELLEAQAVLDAVGVGLCSATEPFDTTTPMGRFMFQLLGSIAELEKSVILERTTGGRARVARDGKWAGGPPPYGYRIVDGRLAPSDRLVEPLGLTEADVVTDLFQRIADGSTMLQECKRLNAAGVTGRNGGAWNEGGMSKMLKATVYRGEYTFHGKHGAVTCQVPPLVSPELSAAAHAQLKRNYTQRETKRFNLLRGKIRCECGAAFVCSARTRRKQVYYRCARQLGTMKGTCRASNLNAVALEAYAWGECEEMLNNPTMISQLGMEQYERLAELDATRAQEVQRLQKALAEQEAAKQRIIALVADGKVSRADIDPQLDAIKDAVGRLHSELSALETNHSLAGAYLKRTREAEAMIKELGTRTNLDSPEDRRRAIEVLLSGITVRTVGEGRDKRAELTFRWLGQDPYQRLDLRDLANESTPESLLNDATLCGDSSHGHMPALAPAPVAVPPHTPRPENALALQPR
jgi:site-specific DNA recombinase